jgi:ATP-binding cassette subfamily F protein 2
MSGLYHVTVQVAKEIWICEDQKVTVWDGDILSYKDHLKTKVMKLTNKNAKSTSP